MKFSLSTLLVVILSLGLLFIGIADVIGIFHIKKLFPILAFSRFFDIPSLFIVMGGLLTNASIIYSPRIVGSAFKKVLFIFSHSKNSEENLLEEIETISSWSEKFNSNKVQFFNEMIESNKTGFRAFLFKLSSTNYPTEEILEISRVQIRQNFKETKKLADVFNNMGHSGPAFGMFGTLFGLVYMLSSLDDPSKIGPGLALGLLVTLYGVSLTHLVFYPLAKKLVLAAESEMIREELVLEGFILILEQKPPMFIRDYLSANASRKTLDSMN